MFLFEPSHPIGASLPLSLINKYEKQEQTFSMSKQKRKAIFICLTFELLEFIYKQTILQFIFFLAKTKKKPASSCEQRVFLCLSACLPLFQAADKTLNYFCWQMSKNKNNGIIWQTNFICLFVKLNPTCFYALSYVMGSDKFRFFVLMGNTYTAIYDLIKAIHFFCRQILKYVKISICSQLDLF